MDPSVSNDLYRQWTDDEVPDGAHQLDLSPSQYENVRSTLPTDGNFSSDG